MTKEAVERPDHYQNASGVETVDIAEHLGFNLGNAYKYLDRAGKKDPAKHGEDLQKARWYIRRELARKDMPALALPAAVNKMAVSVMAHTDAKPLWAMARVVRDWDGYGPSRVLLEHVVSAIHVELARMDA